MHRLEEELEGTDTATVKWTDASGVEREIADVRDLPFRALASIRDLQIRALPGGFNHGVFAIEAGGETYCLKLYADSARFQAAREWWALERLSPLGLTPRPIDCTLGCQQAPHGAILMEWVPGGLLTARKSGPDILTGLLAGSVAVHAVEVETKDLPWSAEGHPVQGLIAWLDKAVAAYTRAREQAGDGIGEDQDAALEELVVRCRRLVKHQPPGPSKLRLSRGDPNLNNVLVRSDGSLCFLDWEYSGLGDPAYEYADYVHHPSSDGIPRAEWIAALATYPPAIEDPAFMERFQLYDVLVGAWWCLRLARHILEVAAGAERRPEKASPRMVADSHRRLERLMRDMEHRPF